MDTQLAFLTRNNADNSWIWAMLGACAGLYLFYRGFRLLQRKRLILNTPTSKIRSASLGLVEVNGLAVGPYTMIAPITGMPCFYYRTLAWELRKSGKSREWHNIADESLHVPFYLDDNTGRLLVNPQGAEMDIHRDFHEEYSNSFFSSREMPANVSGFLTRHGVAGEHKVRLDEYCIKPKNALFILGTLAENPDLPVSPRPIPTQHAAQLRFNLPRTSTTFGIALQSRPSLTTQPIIQQTIQLSSTKHASTAEEMAQQSKIAAALVKAGITNPAAWAAAGIENPAAAMANVARPVISTGAAAAAPQPAPDFDLQPKAVMMKGENDPSFLISWRSQREVIRSLGWKSVACIWGGPILTLLSVYVLLAHFGWL
jgi:hypothetical protein